MVKKRIEQIPILNPCKHCLKRPVCNNECEDFENHKEVKEVLLLIGTTVAIMTFYVSTCLMYWFMLDQLYVKVVIGLVTTVAYIHTVSTALKNLNEFKQYKLGEMIFYFLIGPFAELTAWIYYSTRLENKVEEHAYRYIKSIWNRKYNIEGKYNS